MKNIQFLFSLGLMLSFFIGLAQKKNEFIRVYDLEGQKLHKGYITDTDDHNLHLKRGTKTYTVPYTAIGHIKAYRSLGHYAGGGAGYAALAGAGVGLIILSQASNETSGIGGAVGTGIAAATPVVFGLAGSIGGLITYAGKKKITFEVQGDKSQWEHFRNVYYGTTNDATNAKNETNTTILSPDTNGI